MHICVCIYIYIYIYTYTHIINSKQSYAKVSLSSIKVFVYALVMLCRNIAYGIAFLLIIWQ